MIRIFKALIRYYLAFKNLGFYPSLKIVYYSAFSKKDIDTHFNTRKFGKIFWNTRKDWVISHFYTPQIEIYSPSGVINVKNIIDLGANIGTESLRLSRMYPNAKIVSVEAEKRNFESLKKNTSDNHSIEIIHGAIWGKESKLRLNSSSLQNSQSWYLEEAKSNENFDMIGLPFNKILQNFKFDSVDILKVDIEGAEKELFSKECSQWIHKIKCMIIECPDNDNPLTTARIYKNLANSDYHFNTYLNGENLVLVRNDLDWMPRFKEQY